MYYDSILSREPSRTNGPLGLYNQRPVDSQLLLLWLARPKTRATSIALYRLTTDHLLCLVRLAKELASGQRSASIEGKLSYLCRLRGIKSIAPQSVVLERCQGFPITYARFLMSDAVK